MMTSVNRAAPAIEYRKSWPRPASACGLVPKWKGKFANFNDWCNFATARLTGTYDTLKGGELKAICIDALGRRCTMGAHFMRARDEDAFPVRYFWECETTPAADLLTALENLIPRFVACAIGAGSDEEYVEGAVAMHRAAVKRARGL